MEFRFNVDSALLGELGERLVESVHVALTELVKNAYDADATEVVVKIRPAKRGGPEVEVIDNGSGMTLSEVRDYWMKIATTNKLKKKLSPKYGRPRTGSKGIGRFSCRRLGKKLVLVTTAKHSSRGFQQIKVDFDWNRFKAGTEISEIQCPGSKKFVTSSTPGTRLIINGSPTDEWKKQGFDYLKRRLALLVANRGAKRKGYKIDPGFTIKLDAPGFSEDLIDLRDELIDAGWGTVVGEVDKRGNAVLSLSAKGIGEKRMKYPHKIPNLCGV